jgi:photosystem II stability/assembly factor-like uncharacterized protein
MKFGRAIAALLTLTAASSVAHAAWERQYLCQQGSSFVSIAAYDENHAMTCGSIDDGSGSGSKPALYSTYNGKAWAQAAYDQVSGSIFTVPLTLSAPSQDGMFLGVYNLGLKPTAEFERKTYKDAKFILGTGLQGNSKVTPTAIHFIDKNTGWYLGRGEAAIWLNRTTDGGKTWENLTGIAYEADIEYTSMFFINDRFGWIAGGDQGAWDETDKDKQIRPAGRGILQYTTDGGKTWTKAVSEAPRLFEAITFYDCLHGWASVTANYTKAGLLKTDDGGKTWNEALFPKHSTQNKDYNSITAIRFFDFTEGWAAAYWDSGTHSSPTYWTELLHTVDGGKNWKVDALYNEAAKATTDAACCMPQDMCKLPIMSMIGQYAGAIAMDWPTRNTGYVSGTSAIVMKYTAAPPSTGAAPRCVSCCGGKCPNDTDGGFSATCGQTDAGVPDAQTDGAMIDGGTDPGVDGGTDDGGTAAEDGGDGGKSKKDGGTGEPAGGCACSALAL